jgi:hypothetical protein
VVFETTRFFVSHQIAIVSLLVSLLTGSSHNSVPLLYAASPLFPLTLHRFATCQTTRNPAAVPITHGFRHSH